MSSSPDGPGSLASRIRRALFGAPRDLRDRTIHHQIALIPLLAWVGLGADGLSSSAYGPEEAFRTLTERGEHTYLAIALAGAMAFTVLVIAAAYSKIIEAFPQGGGGYVVATSLLGPRWGLASGCALLIDYVLTITVSIAAAGDALFSFVDPRFQGAKLWVEFALIMLLVILNIRGLRESVMVLVPIFATFAITHLIVIIGGFLGNLSHVQATASAAANNFHGGLTTLGLGGMLLLFMRAYSLGGGTYTGIEAVSNGLMVLREPRVQNGKRTMLYMALSLAFTASGLILLYLLCSVKFIEGKTMNAALVEKMTEDIWGGGTFTVITLLSEGALLVVAAQAGFVGGPRTLAYMAADSWAPRRFAALSERLTTHNGIALMGIASLLALIYTVGNVRHLVVLYSINVFITFALSMFGMCGRAWRAAGGSSGRMGEIVLFGGGFLMCATILVVTVYEKFDEGGWLTLVFTGGLVGVCFWVRQHYRAVAATLNKLYAQLEKLPPMSSAPPPALDPKQSTAVLMVGGYGGLGIHTFGNIFRAFPGFYKNVVFMSIGVVDSGEFKGEHSVDQLREKVQQGLDQYTELARRFGVPATTRMAIGTDVVEEAEQLCLATAKEFPRCTFFAGKVIFQRETWYHRLLHNETALAVQKRLYWSGHVMVILPARIA